MKEAQRFDWRDVAVQRVFSFKLLPLFELQLVLKQYAHIIFAQKGELIIIDFLININLILVILNKLNKLCRIITIKILKRFDELLQLGVVHVHKLLKQVPYPY